MRFLNRKAVLFACTGLTLLCTVLMTAVVVYGVWIDRQLLEEEERQTIYASRMLTHSRTAVELAKQKVEQESHTRFTPRFRVLGSSGRTEVRLIEWLAELEIPIENIGDATAYRVFADIDFSESQLYDNSVVGERAFRVGSEAPEAPNLYHYGTSPVTLKPGESLDCAEVFRGVSTAVVKSGGLASGVMEVFAANELQQVFVERFEFTISARSADKLSAEFNRVR